MNTRLRYTLSILLMIGLLSPAYASVPADSTDTPAPETLVQVELTRSLTSDAVQKQKRAARRIRTYAHTDRYSEAFFRPLVPHLHDIASDSQRRSLRILAISALSAIGNDTAVRGLKAQVISFEPGPIRRLTVHVIAQHDTGWTVVEANHPTR